MGPGPVSGADVFAPREPSRDAVLPVLAAVAAGGALGAAARYLASERWPTAPGDLPLTTAAINLLGSAAIGVLMVVVSERWPHRRLVRPFLGTGVLGGFTTFSTYAVDVQHLATGGQPLRAAVYLVATPVLALLAAAVGSQVARMLYTRRSR
jgi:CrcB protein